MVMTRSRTQKVQRTMKPCHYCVNNAATVDYKDVQTLKKFVSSYCKIAPPRRSGLCAWHQRKVARAVKQSRIAGLMAFVPK